MNGTSDQILTRPARVGWYNRFQVVALAAITLISIIGKFYLPRLVPHTEWLELPLLLTVYFGLMHHSPIGSLFFGAFVGLAEDSLAGEHSYRNVRHYQDVGRILCRISQPAF